jgi:putative transposase
MVGHREGETARGADEAVLSQSWPTDLPGLRLVAAVSSGERAMIEFKGSHFERDVILWAVRWYVAYPINYRQLEEMTEEHGVAVDHATLNRWVLKCVPLLEQEFRSRKRPVGSSWRMDETYVRVRDSWKYLYRAVDKAGATVDFLLTTKRDRKAAPRFLSKAIKWNVTPKKITIDKSGANAAAIESHNAEQEAGTEIRQIKYLNNIVEQDHRAIKRLLRPMLGFKSFGQPPSRLPALNGCTCLGRAIVAGRRHASIAASLFASSDKPIFSRGYRTSVWDICDRTAFRAGSERAGWRRSTRRLPQWTSQVKPPSSPAPLPASALA